MGKETRNDAWHKVDILPEIRTRVVVYRGTCELRKSVTRKMMGRHIND